MSPHRWIAIRRWIVITTIGTIVLSQLAAQPLHQAHPSIGSAVITLNLVAFVVGGFLCLFIHFKLTSVLEEVIRSGAKLCPGCGYTLEGLDDEGACPECGAPYEMSAVREWWSQYRRALLLTLDAGPKPKLARRGWMGPPRWDHRQDHSSPHKSPAGLGAMSKRMTTALKERAWLRRSLYAVGILAAIAWALCVPLAITCPPPTTTTTSGPLAQATAAAGSGHLTLPGAPGQQWILTGRIPLNDRWLQRDTNLAWRFARQLDRMSGDETISLAILIEGRRVVHIEELPRSGPVSWDWNWLTTIRDAGQTITISKQTGPHGTTIEMSP